MKFSITLFALSASVALAAPAAEKTLVKRRDPGVYLCNDRDWKGYCVHIVAPQFECVPLAADLNDKISSAGPDVGSFCTFYVDPNCNRNADSFFALYPGISDLTRVPWHEPAGSFKNFEDKISSYSCQLQL